MGTGLWGFGLQGSVLDQARTRLQSKDHLLLQLREDKELRRHDSPSKGGRGCLMFFTELRGGTVTASTGKKRGN